MSKGTLTFELPEEQEEFQVAVDGLYWRAIVEDTINSLNDTDMSADEIRASILLSVANRGLYLP